jgi:hypothetical protein
VKITVEEISRIMNALYDHRAPNVPLDGLSDIFDRLCWCLDDEGDALLKVREEWLRSDDRGRVEVALEMKDTFPFREATVMAEVFGRISSKWPELAARCRELSERRARTGG